RSSSSSSPSRPSTLPFSTSLPNPAASSVSMTNSVLGGNHEADAVIEDKLAPVPAGDPRKNGGKPRQEQPLRQDVEQVGRAHAPVGTHHRDEGHGRNGMRPACNARADA